MSDSKFTPGPWSIDSTGSVVSASNDYVAEAFDGLPGRETDQEIARANARLIAAAPELYEALDSVSISGPDADGIIWLHVKSNGLHGMFNLGSDPATMARRALIGAFELRRNALLKASGGSDV